ncbi:MAG: hypothetical protein ACRELD_02030 [Longimicrobiales bacterium]
MMPGRKMEGNEQQRRDKARDAREAGERPSERSATRGASKQRKHLGNKAGHREKLETIREGKQRVIRENRPEPRPGARED